MEITNDIKEKVFAQYLGQCVTAIRESDDGNISYKAGDNFILKLINIGYFQIDGGEENENWNFGVEQIDGSCVLFWADSPGFKLILRPISAITDEDANMVIDIGGPVQLMYGCAYRGNTEEEKRKYISSAFEIARDIPAPTFQFLQSRGYDLPHYLLGGKRRRCY